MSKRYSRRQNGLKTVPKIIDSDWEIDKTGNRYFFLNLHHVYTKLVSDETPNLTIHLIWSVQIKTFNTLVIIDWPFRCKKSQLQLFKKNWNPFGRLYSAICRSERIFYVLRRNGCGRPNLISALTAFLGASFYNLADVFLRGAQLMDSVMSCCTAISA